MELKNGDELSLGVASASIAKKSKKLADSFVAFVYKSAVPAAKEEDEIHPAFLDPEGPAKVRGCSVQWFELH
jgi:hypothetical protein